MSEPIKLHRLDLYGEHYPESWYMVMPAKDLKKGNIKSLDILGKALMAYRTSTGKVVMQSRFCPHMGASLAKGQIEGDRVVCPFHHWEYNGAGACVKIPYMEDDKIPRGAKLETYPVVEHLGWIWIFNGPVPTHELPDIPEARDGNFGLRYKSQPFDIHPLLILENGCDAQHFKYVHKVDYKKYEVEITRDEPHYFWFTVHQDLQTPVGRSLSLKTVIHYVGASVIFGQLDFGDKTVARFIAAPLPVGPKKTLFHLIVYGRRLPLPLRMFDPIYLSWFARKLFSGSTDDYFPVWKEMNTDYRRYLVAEDKLQQRFRAYYRNHLRVPTPQILGEISPEEI